MGEIADRNCKDQITTTSNNRLEKVRETLWKNKPERIEGSTSLRSGSRQTDRHTHLYLNININTDTTESRLLCPGACWVFN